MFFLSFHQSNSPEEDKSLRGAPPPESFRARLSSGGLEGGSTVWRHSNHGGISSVYIALGLQGISTAQNLNHLTSKQRLEDCRVRDGSRTKDTLLRPRSSFQREASQAFLVELKRPSLKLVACIQAVHFTGCAHMFDLTQSLHPPHFVHWHLSQYLNSSKRHHMIFGKRQKKTSASCEIEIEASYHCPHSKHFLVTFGGQNFAQNLPRFAGAILALGDGRVWGGTNKQNVCNILTYYEFTTICIDS